MPTSRIGCLLGKGGAIINEMRKLTKANIRILGKDNIPKVASEDDEMVQVRPHLNWFWDLQFSDHLTVRVVLSFVVLNVI